MRDAEHDLVVAREHRQLALHVARFGACTAEAGQRLGVEGALVALELRRDLAHPRVAALQRVEQPRVGARQVVERRAQQLQQRAPREPHERVAAGGPRAPADALPHLGDVERGDVGDDDRALALARQALVDHAQAARHRRAGDLGAVRGADVERRAGAALARLVLVLEDAAHQLRGLVDVGLGPLPVGRIGLARSPTRVIV